MKSPIQISSSFRQRGQVLILVAVAFVGLMAIIGLAIDTGYYFIMRGNLQRATDAGALAAAAQFREGRTFAEMQSAAKEAVKLNDFDPTNVTVEICDPTAVPPDPELCTNPPSKLVRVTVSADINTIFFRVIGFNKIPATTTATSEAASMDVVLVIDVSESMTFEATSGTPLRDPYYCNHQDPGGSDGYPGECQPFEKVKESAINFIQKILDNDATFEQDRVAIVAFSDGVHSWYVDPANPTNTNNTTPVWISDRGTAVNAIKQLTVYEPGTCQGVTDPYTGSPGTTYWGPCRNYDGSGNYTGLFCMACDDNAEWSPYMTTNIGGGLKRAGNMFAYQTRESALWIVVLLTDGLANATDLENTDVYTDPGTWPIGFCPDWVNLCQDNDTTTRHASGNGQYDADDYARDMADFVGCFPTNPASGCANPGQGAVIFTIGLGPEVTNNYGGTGLAEANGIPYGASLLRYIAAVGYDGDPVTDPCASYSSDYTAWCGNYYYSPSGAQLNRVFEDIASRIFTRLRK